MGVGLLLSLFLSGLVGCTVHGGAELLVLVAPQGLGHELVHFLCEVEDLHPLILQSLQLRQLVDFIHGVTGGIIDDLLILLHPGDVLIQRHQLLLRGGPEQQQILQQVLVDAVLADHAVFQLAAEVLPEGFISLTLVLEHLGQFALDLLFQISGDDLQLAVMLQKLPGDVQTQIRGIHHAPDKPEVLRQQIRTLVHNENAAGIELQTLFVFLGVEVEGSGAGDEQQGLVGHGTLGGHGDDPLGVREIVELLPIELVIFLRLHVGLFPLPDGDHGVQGLHLHIGYLVRLVGHAGGHLFRFRDRHADGEADVVGILFDQLPELPFFQKLAVMFVLCIILQVHDDLSARIGLITFRDGVAVGP